MNKHQQPARAIRTLSGTPKHLSRTGGMEGFTYLMLTLPFKCNYRCLKCFNLANDQPVTTGDPISLENLLGAIGEAKIMRGQVVVIAGEGEPTLHKDIRNIVSQIAHLGMIPIVYSNGYALTPPMADFYCKKNTCLVIALDSLKPDVYRLLTGTKGDALPLVLRNIANLKKVYSNSIEDRNGIRILRLALNMTVCSRNKREIAEVKALAGDDMYFVCNPLARQGNAESNWPALIDSEEDFAEQQRLVKESSESGGPLTLDCSGLCGYSVNGIGIGPCGHYMTCAYTSKTNGLLGTIHDRSLQEAYEFKTKIEREHYAKYGSLPCLIRDASFSAYLNNLYMEIDRKEKALEKTGSPS
jgi:MoaA/NifB/PqqE/SkfB family radical SAM enzyme